MQLHEHGTKLWQLDLGVVENPVEEVHGMYTGRENKVHTGMQTQMDRYS